MNAMPRRFLLFAGLAAAVSATAGLAQSPPTPTLGSASSFAVLGGSAVNNNVDTLVTGDTVVTGNVGVAPGNTIAGFPPGKIRLGTTASNDALARQAQSDATAAYNDLATRSCLPLHALTDVPPGVYCVSSPLSGVITLNAGSTASAVWIFLVRDTLAVAANSTIAVTNGGENGHVYWQVGNDVTLGNDSKMVGNILARGDIAFGHGASLSGRALSRGGTVTLDANNVSLCCAPITLSPLPNGNAGTPYSSTVTASGSLPDYSFTVIEGTPPTGLECGRFTFTVMATDALGCHGVRRYTVDITGPIDIVPHDLPPATACLHYEQTITATCGIPPYIFNGAPPPNLSLSPETGLLSGIPAAAGTYSFPVTVTDTAGVTATRRHTLLVLPNTLTILPSTLPDGFVCVPYRQEFTPAGCPGPFTCTVTGGSLPPGLSLANCVLSDVPTQAGTYTFTVTATDVSGSTGSNAYTVTIHCSPITISPTTLPDGVVGTFFTAQLQATDACGPPFTFALAPGSLLPTNLMLAAGGTLSGTPTAPGTFTFTVIATDRYGCSGSQDVTIKFNPVCELTLSPTTLPNGTVGFPYPPTTITVTGGTSPYTFAISSGSLPPVLKLSPSGIVYGTPTTPGSYSVTIRVTDSQGCTPGTITYPIVIKPAPVFTVGVPTLSHVLLLVLALLVGAAGLFATGRSV